VPRRQESELALRLLDRVAREAIASCGAEEAVRRACAVRQGRVSLAGRPVPVDGAGRILVIAYGKAAIGMTRGLLRRIHEAGGPRPVVGLVVAPAGTGTGWPFGDLPRSRFRLAVVEGDHPVPGRGSFAAGRRALQIAGHAGRADDIVFLASGGGSAMLAAPLPRLVTPAGKAGIHRALIASGAPIASINAVRKHLSAIKGGRLAVAAQRARSQTTLIVCDVDLDRVSDVASGPSLPDRTTVDDMVRIIDRYGVAPQVPPMVLEALRVGRLPETPKPRAPEFRRSGSSVVLSNRDLRNAAARAALSRGLPAEAVPYEMAGAIETAVETVARAIESAPPGTRLLVFGGEVLVAPNVGGTGGRAQELALRLALRMAGLGSRPWAFLAAGSDGVDGNSPAAGAFVDGTTLERARAAGIEVAKILKDSNTWRLFSRLGDALVTGPTGTNVRDVYLLLTGSAAAAPRGLDPFRSGIDRPPSPEEPES
jgi:glycerate-2-kinase